MSEPIKQHYVPQVYLLGFSNPVRNVHQTFALLKNQKKVFPTNIEDVCAERHFYTDESRNDKYQWEKLFAQTIEPILSNVLIDIHRSCDSILIRDKSTVLSKKLKQDLTLSMTFQFLRGNIVREFARRKYNLYIEDHINELEEMEESKLLPSDFITSIKTDKEFKSMLFRCIFSSKSTKSFYQYLINRDFVVFRAPGKEEFISSDNPIMFINTATGDATPLHNGLIYPSTAVYFPLTPKLLLAVYHPDAFYTDTNLVDRKLFYLNGKNCSSFIARMNQKQIEQCYNIAFAKSRNSLTPYLR